MSWFPTIGGRLHAEQVPLADIAERFGTPTWVYSRGAIEGAWDEFAQATVGRRALVCYAIKANSNLAVLELLARPGGLAEEDDGGLHGRVHLEAPHRDARPQAVPAVAVEHLRDEALERDAVEGVVELLLGRRAAHLGFLVGAR
jgi:hypothetical protein